MSGPTFTIVRPDPVELALHAVEPGPSAVGSCPMLGRLSPDFGSSSVCAKDAIVDPARPDVVALWMQTSAKSPGSSNAWSGCAGKRLQGAGRLRPQFPQPNLVKAAIVRAGTCQEGRLGGRDSSSELFNVGQPTRRTWPTRTTKSSCALERTKTCLRRQGESDANERPSLHASLAFPLLAPQESGSYAARRCEEAGPDSETKRVLCCICATGSTSSLVRPGGSSETRFRSRDETGHPPVADTRPPALSGNAMLRRSRRAEPDVVTTALQFDEDSLNSNIKSLMNEITTTFDRVDHLKALLTRTHESLHKIGDRLGAERLPLPCGARCNSAECSP